MEDEDTRNKKEQSGWNILKRKDVFVVQQGLIEEYANLMQG